MTYDRNALFGADTDHITSLKGDVDALLRQLSEGEYLSMDTFANNWVHLMALYARIQEKMNDQPLMDRLVRTDLLLTADLMAVGRMIMVINNFLRCAAAQNVSGNTVQFRDQ